jgi:uncharacterized membrane protein
MNQRAHARSPGRLSRLHARGRLIWCAAGGAAVAALIAVLAPDATNWGTRLLIGWNVAVALHLTTTLVIGVGSTVESMRERAAREDEGVVASFAVSIAAAIASVGAIGMLLAGMKDLAEPVRSGHLVLTVLTILCSWTFIHAMFALHYAHVYYSPGERRNDDGTPAEQGGLDFPGDDDPDFWDFFYFAFTIGTTAQTSDVGIQSRTIRRLTLAHAIIAFFFNTAILAMVVNLTASLL